MKAINTWQHEQLMELVSKQGSLTGTEKQEKLQGEAEQLQHLYDGYRKNLLTLRQQIKEYESVCRRIKTGIRSNTMRWKKENHEKV